ncbi:hypothetical protein PTKIN_Ptkin11bG0183900 [Pterospermum kingtungense]
MFLATFQALSNSFCHQQLQKPLDITDFLNLCGVKEKYEMQSEVNKYDNFSLEYELGIGKNPTKENHVKLKILFSYKSLPDILRYFSFEPNSTEARIVKYTIDACEASPLYGEEKYCTRTLESFMDAAVAKLGKKSQAAVQRLHTQ